MLLQHTIQACASIALLSAAILASAAPPKAAPRQKVEPTIDVGRISRPESLSDRNDRVLAELRTKFTAAIPADRRAGARMDLWYLRSLHGESPVNTDRESPPPAAQSQARNHLFLLDRTGVPQIFRKEDLIIVQKPRANANLFAGVIGRFAEKLGFGKPSSVDVAPSVARFADAYWTGAKNPGPFLEVQALLSGPESEVTKLLFRWAATPKAKRVFVTGSQGDWHVVQKLEAHYALSGYNLFFYLHCKPLCAEETIGALFATSGTALHVQSPRTLKSEFVPIEVASALAIDKEGERPSSSGRFTLVIYSAAEVLANLNSKASFAATQLECSDRNDLKRTQPRIPCLVQSQP